MITVTIGYVWWLVLEVVFAVVASVALNRVIARTYPCLKTDLYVGKELARKYPDVLTKVKQLFFHKIAGFALTQSSYICLYDINDSCFVRQLYVDCNGCSNFDDGSV